MTTTPTPSPEAEALPTLPVVASREDFEAWARPYLTCDPKGVMGNYDPLEWVVDWNGREHYYGQDASRMWDSWQASRCAPAEAAIVALRAEVAELRKDAQRLDWLVAQLSDRDFREAGISYRHGDASLRKSIDSARASLLGDGGTL